MLKETQATRPALLCASSRMLTVLELARRAGESDAKVLITGESGVGKDLIAREIHHASGRSRGPFVAVNCAGVPETLLESELFGHVRGSFTGAYRDRAGKLQLADNGTLFLDEVGEMSLRMQALLLRFLESGEIQTVGDSHPKTVNVRIIAVTNRDLAQRVAAGEFREDLLYRLKVIQIVVPPLRDRPEDVALLAEHFLRRLQPTLVWDEEAMRALVKYRWPGNVRELQNVSEQVACLAKGSSVALADLPEALRATGLMPTATPERRRQIADQLFEALIQKRYTFWNDVYPLFLHRDLTRHDLRELLSRGLMETRGNYRALLSMFGMPVSDYHRFHNFLSTHECRLDFRMFRTNGLVAAARRPALPKVS